LLHRRGFSSPLRRPRSTIRGSDDRPAAAPPRAASRPAPSGRSPDDPPPLGPRRPAVATVHPQRFIPLGLPL